MGGIKTTFTITFPPTGGKTTDMLSPTALPEEIQTALENLKTIKKGNIKVTGNKGGPWTCTFVNALGGKPQPKMNISSTGSVTQKIRILESDWPIAPIKGIKSETDAPQSDHAGQRRAGPL